MANQIGDTISKGNYFNVCTDETNQTFETKSFYTDSEDVSFADGENAENKVGAIKGITSDFNTTDSGYAASMTAVSQLNSSLNGLSFAQDENGKWGYKVGADSVTPFSSGGTVTLTFPNQSRYADQAGTVVRGSLTLSIDSDGVSIVSNNISIQTIYVQRPDMTATWTPTVTAELI